METSRGRIEADDIGSHRTEQLVDGLQISAKLDSVTPEGESADRVSELRHRTYQGAVGSSRGLDGKPAKCRVVELGTKGVFGHALQSRPLQEAKAKGDEAQAQLSRERMRAEQQSQR